MRALSLVIIVASIFTFAAWLRSVITKDYSQVDRIWSIVPEVYIWILVLKNRFHNHLLILCAILVTAWGIRLTYNFARKGGYSGEEDYRWAVLRNSMSKLQFQIFNIFFISIYQNLLLVLITIPAYFLYQKDSGWNAPAIICIFLFILALIGETVADQQQWNFHQLKRENKTDKKFLDRGLFSLSRHPNFFFEQCQWWLLYLIVGFSTNHLLNYSIIGPVLLTLLFIGSTRFTESISLSKYPEYSQYQSRVPGIIPVIGWKKRN